VYCSPKILGLAVVAAWWVAADGRTSATILLDDVDGISTTTTADIVRDAAGLTEPASGADGVESLFGGELNNVQIAIAPPPFEFAGLRLTSLAHATDGPLVDVDSLDYKVLGVSLMDVLIGSKRY
jgi:hypothetical protein